MNQALKEGLLLGVFGNILTFFILFILGLFISFLRFIKSGEVKEFEEPVGFEETREDLINKKKVVALSVALAKYFADKNVTKEEQKVLRSERTLSSLKEKRWRNG
ncbi:MAG: hypothetical protein K6343_00915 [Caldisericaceae bacterium]